MTAAYSVRGDSFEAQKARLWNPTQIADVAANYDVSADGKRVVAIMETAPPAEPERNVTFLFNFLDEVRRRVAAANAK